MRDSGARDDPARLATISPPQTGVTLGRRSKGREGGNGLAQPNLADWHGKDLIDSAGQKIGKLQDVYVDVETDEPMFGTVKEGFIGRHLTCVPLAGVTALFEQALHS
jgi:hypothetical protein